MAVTVDLFLSGLETSNLLKAYELESVRAEAERLGPVEPKVLAGQLIQMGLLTRWQAGMLLAGRNAFFLGKYKLLSELGRGGMGAVFKAEQQPLGRIVALKLMTERLVKDERSVIRFQREIQAAAALQHPNIVSVFDADRAHNTHFLVMEYVEGEDLDVIAKREGKLPISLACEYIRQAALGLQHAHERGVAHRDIKLSNLLLDRRDQTEHVVKILDMGLARFTSESGGDDGSLTQTGQIMGTPDYIAPEQASNTKSADIRSDIYSLGCCLYRLLTGELPYKGSNVMEKLMARAMSDTPRLRSRLPGAPAALEEVVSRMTSRDPDQRYQTPAAAADALAPFAAAATSTGGAMEPVSSKPDSSQELRPAGHVDNAMGEFFRNLANEAEEDAAPAVTLHSVSDTDVDKRPAADELPTKKPSRSRAEPVKPAHGPRGRSASQRRPKGPDRTLMLMVAGGLGICIALFAGYLLWQKMSVTTLVIDWPLDEREGAKLVVDGHETTLPELPTLKLSGSAGKRSVQLSRAGYKLIEETVTLGRGATQTIRPEWIPTTETVRAHGWSTLKQKGEAALAKLATPDHADKLIAAMRGELFEFRRQWPGTPQSLAAAELSSQFPWPVDALSTELIDPYELKVAARTVPDGSTELVGIFGDSRLRNQGPVWCVACSPDGRQVASAGEDFVVRLWDRTTGRETRKLVGHTHSIYAVQYTPEGSRLVSASADRTLRFWDLSQDGEPTVIRCEGQPIEVDLSEDQSQVAAVTRGPDGVEIYNVKTRELVESIRDSNVAVQSARFRRGVAELVMVTVEGRVSVHGLNPFNPAPFQEHKIDNKVWSSSMSADGTRLAVACESGAAWYFELPLSNAEDSMAPSTIRPLLVFPHGAISAGISRDGKLCCYAGGDGTLTLWQVEGEKVLPREVTFRRLKGRVKSTALSADAATIAVGLESGEIALFDARTGAEPNSVVPTIRTAAVSPEGAMFALGRSDGSVLLIDIASGKQTKSLNGHSDAIVALCFSPDGKQLLSGSLDGTLMVWRSPEWDSIVTFAGHGGPITSAAFSPDGKLIGSVSNENWVQLWNPETGTPVHRLDHVPWAASVAFSADGRLVISGGEDLKLWDVQSGSLSKSISLRHIITLAASPDNRRIALTPYESNHELRELPGGTVLQTLERQGSHAHALAFSPDGKLLYSAGRSEKGSHDNRVALWNAESGALVSSIPIGPADWTITQLVPTPDGRHLITVHGNGIACVTRLKKWAPATAP